jgi:Beta-lactamase
MKKSLCTIILISIFSAVYVNAANIIFKVDMRKAKAPANSVVSMRGNLDPLSWKKSNIVLTDDDKDGIFTATVNFDSKNDTKLEYKYLINEKWEDVNNRKINLTETQSTNDVWGQEIYRTAPYFFEKDDKVIDFAARMTSEQVVHGVSQIIMHNDKVDTLMTWGFRDVEGKLPVDANTLFHIGGMSQSITAFAVLRAAEQKRLDLDKPLNTYLISMKIEGDFTVRDLLMGVIKLNGETKPDGYAKGQTIPTLQDIFNGKNSNTPKMKQGSGKSEKPVFNIFSGLLAQQMLEDIYKKTFTEIIQTEVLTPLNMKNTFVKAELSDNETQNASVGYDKSGKAVAGKRLIFPELGFGGVWTTPTDYAKFITYLMKAYRGEDNTLLSKDMAKAALDPTNQFRALIFPQGDNGNYFGGAATGFRTQTSFNAAENWLMVSFMNSYENWRTMLDVEKAGKQFLKSKM